MTEFEMRASKTFGPTVQDTDEKSKCVRVSVSGTSKAILMPADWQGKFVDIRAFDVDMDFYFTWNSAATVVYDEAATAAATQTVTRGKRLKADTERPYIVPKYARGTNANKPDVYLVVEAAGAGSIEITVSE